MYPRLNERKIEIDVYRYWMYRRLVCGLEQVSETGLEELHRFGVVVD